MPLEPREQARRRGGQRSAVALQVRDELDVVQRYGLRRVEQREQRPGRSTRNASELLAQMVAALRGA